MNELSKQYNPQETEDKWYRFWEENNFFAAKPDPAKTPFSIVIPPPNVTGILHMGHALNNTIQDILIRYHRMKGEETLWMPGTDHAGIATQNVVEKSIAKEGLRRQDLGREKFIQRVWQWREQYGSTIIRQLKKLGSSCDWQRTRFTMDDEYSKAVLEVFIRLYEKGLIYQGSYIINWCPRCQTALSDEEAPHRELQGILYYIRYPLKEVSQLAGKPVSRLRPANRQAEQPANYIVVATTRPETMLGDTAVAVNPKDRRYKGLVGKTLVLPLVNREIKIIADTMVDMKFGTGAVKVTPAHDPNDYALGKKHKLEFVNIMAPDGQMNEKAGNYKDMDRFEAREVILEDLKEKGLLEKVEPHTLSAGHCYRCHTIIEPYLSKQWFVKMKPLSIPGMEMVRKGKIKFYPKRWTKVYLNWMENIQDWCISRQIWWGHRLPVYYCKNCQKQASERTENPSTSLGAGREQRTESAKGKKGIIVSRVKPEKCTDCGSTDIYQDEDVLDTWFSSWLWPFATFYWPFLGKPVSQSASQPVEVSQLASEPVNRLTRSPANPLTGSPEDLSYFYPTSVLVTAPEIIFFWVARMIMAGLEFMQDIPFKDVYIHGTVRDIEGKKMSKSLGNIIDPLDIIKEYGADALRFSLISITAQGQDVFLSKERFEQGRNFANKIWNASRFILMNLEPENVRVGLCVFFQKEQLGIINRWILSRFYSVLKETGKYLEAYKFNEAANLLYGFFWHEFCDWYLELVKLTLENREQRTENRNTQVVMYKVLEKFLRVLHPFMPFITEEIWQRLGQQTNQLANQQTSIMLQPWPHIQEQMIDKRIEPALDLVFEIITAIRNMRQELDIPAGKVMPVVLATAVKENRELLEALAAHIKALSHLETLSVVEKFTPIKSSVSSVIKDVHITIPLIGVVDIEKEKVKMVQRIEKTEAEIKSKERTLGNKEFLKKAPEEVVKKEEARLRELRDILKRLRAIRDEL